MKLSAREILDSHEEMISRMCLSPRQLRRLRSVFEEDEHFVNHPDFRRPALMRAIMQRQVRVSPGETLSPQDDRTLFMQMNYAKHKVYHWRRVLARRSLWRRSSVLSLLDWFEAYLDARSKIVTANMGLVVFLARSARYATVECADLVGEGNLALLRAATRYDCSLGYKFSTYASRVILSSFARLAGETSRYRRLFPVQWDPQLETADSSYAMLTRRAQAALDDVQALFGSRHANLSDLERVIAAGRYGLNPASEGPLTLRELGVKFGLSKERIRQVQNSALTKLRRTAEQQMRAGRRPAGGPGVSRSRVPAAALFCCALPDETRGRTFHAGQGDHELDDANDQLGVERDHGRSNDERARSLCAASDERY